MNWPMAGQGEIGLENQTWRTLEEGRHSQKSNKPDTEEAGLMQNEVTSHELHGRT